MKQKFLENKRDIAAPLKQWIVTHGLSTAGMGYLAGNLFYLGYQFFQEKPTFDQDVLRDIVTPLAYLGANISFIAKKVKTGATFSVLGSSALFATASGLTGQDPMVFTAALSAFSAIGTSTGSYLRDAITVKDDDKKSSTSLAKEGPFTTALTIFGRNAALMTECMRNNISPLQWVAMGWTLFSTLQVGNAYLKYRERQKNPNRANLSS